MDRKRRSIMVIVVILMVCLAALCFTSCVQQKEEGNNYHVTFDTVGGSYIEEQVIRSGDKVKEPADPNKQGYTFVGWLYNGEDFDFDQEIITSDVTLKAVWNARTDTPYKVEHYLQDLEGDGYTLAEEYTENKLGTTDSLTDARAKEPEGYAAKAFVQEPVAGDGSTIIRIYYERKTFTITFAGEENIPPQSVRYGGKVKEPEVARLGCTAVWKVGDQVYDFEETISSSFEIRLEWRVNADWSAPSVSLSYYVKYIAAGDQVELPEVYAENSAGEMISAQVKLLKDDVETEVPEGDTLQSVKGHYKVVVTATDHNGLSSQQICHIYAGNIFDKQIAVDWENTEVPVQYCEDPANAQMSVDTELFYPGFGASFVVDFQEEADTHYLILKNSLIADISQYDYICFYVYNGMDADRMLSLNWTDKYTAELIQGNWTPVCLPICPEIVSASYDETIKENLDWRDLNGMRFYIQNLYGVTGTTSGKLYFSNIYLLNDVVLSEFNVHVEAFKTMSDSDDYGTNFRQIDMEYRILSVSAAADIQNTYTEAYVKLKELLLKEQYDDTILVYSGDKNSPSQIVKSGDVWSVPSRVGVSSEKAYGTESGSVEVVFGAGYKYANISISLAATTKIPTGGTIEFYVYNETGKELEIFTDEMMTTGVYPVTAETGWQKAELDCAYDTKADGLVIYIRGKGESTVSEEGGRSIYLSNIRITEAKAEGIWYEASESGMVQANTKQWTGNLTYGVTSEQQKEGKDTMKLEYSGTNWGAGGVFLNTHRIEASMKAEGCETVTLRFSYYIESKNSNLNYIRLGDVSNGETGCAQEIGGTGAWYEFEGTYREFNDTFGLCLTQNATCTWTGGADEFVMYITDICYVCNFS